MKYLLTLFLELIFSALLKAQPTQADKDFMRDVIKLKRIIYVDSADVLDNDIRKILDADTIKTLTRDRFFLTTREEHAYIKRELDSMKFFEWDEGLFKKAKLIKADTLKAIFKSPDRYEASQRFHAKYGGGYYSFSKPIFLRNNTLCILYSYYSCVSTIACGGYYLAIYRKEHGHWRQWQLLAAGDY